jgi:CHAT domain-containing protein
VLLQLGDEAPIADAVDAWIERLSTPPPPDVAGARLAESRARLAGERLRRAIWDPLQGALHGASDLCIVTDGPLHDLPWLALPSGRDRYTADEPLRVHVLSAERELLHPSHPVASPKLLAIGDPDFDAADARAAVAANANAPYSTRRLPGGCARADETLQALPGARREAGAVAALWAKRDGAGAATVLLGADASEQRFKDLAPGCGAIHLATHGILTRDSCESAPVAMRGVGGISSLDDAGTKHRHGRRASEPPPAPEPSPWLGRDVWLAFAGANHAAAHRGDDNDGWLTADEVVTLDLRSTERVVLSACQSGVVDRWSPDALLGMRRAFHLAGAHVVIASRWPIADEATRAWMEGFYASRSPSAGVALQEACRSVLASRRAHGATTHPFFWAAFTATGD